MNRKDEELKKYSLDIETNSIELVNRLLSICQGSDTLYKVFELDEEETEKQYEIEKELAEKYPYKMTRTESGMVTGSGFLSTMKCAHRRQIMSSNLD